MAPLKPEKVELNLSERVYNTLRDKTPAQEPVIKDDPFYQTRRDDRTEFSIMGGFIKNPFGDIWNALLSMQGTGMCGQIETDMMNCLEAYGFPKAYSKCRYMAEDLFECGTTWKRTARLSAMRAERRRQYLTGERKIKYAPPPVIGSYER